MAISPLVVYIFFFGSGFAALLYQVVWLKYLNLLFGSTTYAAAAVLAAFMCGLSLGSLAATRFPKLFQSSLRSYGLLEIGIGLFAITFPHLYSAFKMPFAWIFNLVGPQTFVYNLLTFLLAFLVLLIPTSLMGATLPILSHYLISDENVTRRSGTLYAINTTGAVFGVLISAFIIIPAIGLQATVHIGALINAIVGLICYFSGKITNASEIKKRTLRMRGNFVLYLYAISGLIAIGYEVLWTRLLVLHLGNSVYAYAIMLSVFLIGISVGSYVSGKWMARSSRSPIFFFSVIQIAWAFSILFQMIQFENLSSILVRLAELFGGVTVSTQFVILFLGAVQLLLLPTFLSGALFPAIVTWLWKNGGSVEDSIGLSYSYNTIGGVLGAVLTGFLMLPLFGTQGSLLVLACGNAFLAILAFYFQPKGVRQSKWIPVPIALLFVVCSVLFHQRMNIIESAEIFASDAETELIHIQEDITATITVEKRQYMGKPFRSLSVNGVNVAGTSPNLFAIQKMQAHLPILLFGPEKNKEILHIGFGSGGTAYSASLYPNSRITVVEISRGVVRSADNFFPEVNHGIARSGLLNMIYFDGRSYLQNTSHTYDVILSDSVHPRYSGNGSLYTKDYYALVYDHLRSGGVHSQWIPIYSVAQRNLQEILKAFAEVFEQPTVWYVNSTINPYIIVTGRKHSAAISIQNFQTAFRIPSVAQDLKSVSILHEMSLLDYFLLGSSGLTKYTGDAEPHTDDSLSVEYESSRIIHRQLSWWSNFRDLIRFREPIRAYLAFPDSLNRVNYERFYKATELNLLGQLYFVGGRPEQAKQVFSDAAKLNESDRDPLEYYQKSF
jgi:spermidine synthase